MKGIVIAAIILAVFFGVGIITENEIEMKITTILFVIALGIVFSYIIFSVVKEQVLNYRQRHPKK